MTKTGDFLWACVFVVYASFGWQAHAAEGVQVQAQVDRNEMALGDTFTLTVSVAQKGSADIQTPRIPDFTDFEMLNSWESSSSSHRMMQTAQGMKYLSENRKNFNYMLSPKKMGSLSISAVDVNVDGTVYKTQPVLIKVLPPGSAPAARKAVPSPGAGAINPFDDMENEEDDIFNQLLQQRQRMMEEAFGGRGGGRAEPSLPSMKNPQLRTLPQNPSEAFFIQVEVDKTTVYEGEQITVNWYLYTRGQIETLDRLKFPDLKGFWKEIIEEVPSLQFTQEVVNGIPYKKALLASHALFPIKAGQPVIDEYKIRSRVRVPTTFGGFFGTPYEFTKLSQRVKITAKPLPTEGRPSDFTGAVGQFEVQAQLESKEVYEHQPFSLKIRFEGEGNAKLIELPKLDWPAGLEVYDTKSDAKFFKNGKSYKEFEVLLIPRQSGNIQIPELNVSLFNPRTGTYYKKSTPAFTVQVLPAEKGTDSPVVGPEEKKADVSKKTSEAKLIFSLQAGRYSWWQNILNEVYFWLILFLLIALGLLVYAQSQLQLWKKNRGLSWQINKKLKIIDESLKKNDFRAIGTGLINVFYLLIVKSTKDMNADFKALDFSSLSDHLSPSLKAEIGDELKKQFEILQALAFAPEESLGSIKNESILKTNIEASKKLIQKILQQMDEPHA